ncbi:hypothetical protein [Gilliamella sp. BG6]|uniref:hypothetical protein n=1 Tax=unclassified Gilliamella TaxID=2685620 RepID=UPI003986D388
MINLQSYANAIIYSFEYKKPIKAQPLTGKEFTILLSYINEYLLNKKAGIKGTIDILNQNENLEIQDLQLLKDEQ